MEEGRERAWCVCACECVCVCVSVSACLSVSASVYVYVYVSDFLSSRPLGHRGPNFPPMREVGPRWPRGSGWFCLWVYLSERMKRSVCVWVCWASRWRMKNLLLEFCSHFRSLTLISLPIMWHYLVEPQKKFWQFCINSFLFQSYFPFLENRKLKWNRKFSKFSSWFVMKWRSRAVHDARQRSIEIHHWNSSLTFADILCKSTF